MYFSMFAVTRSKEWNIYVLGKIKYDTYILRSASHTVQVLLMLNMYKT